jgi:LacI family transcriptional regulator
MSVTIRDVALAAGVSRPAVSVALNASKGNTRVSDETRRRVQTIAAQLGYRPHFASRSLARRRAQSLGVFVEPSEWAGLGFDYEGSILKGVEAVCREHDYDIVAINLGGDQTPESCGHKFEEKRIDGLLLLHVQSNAQWVAPLCALHHNVATVNYYGPCRGLDILNFDNVAAGRLAVRHLADMGHRRLGYLGSLDTYTGLGTEQRRNGLLTEVAALGLECRPEWILDPPNRAFMAANEALPYAERFAAAADVIANLRRDGPTAWLAYCDIIAVRVCRWLSRRGLRIPRDLSLMGIDNAQYSEFHDPSLSTVQQPFSEMGAQAAELLIRRAEQGFVECPHTLQLSAPALVVRESTAAPTSIDASGPRRPSTPAGTRRHDRLTLQPLVTP